MVGTNGLCFPPGPLEDGATMTARRADMYTL